MKLTLLKMVQRCLSAIDSHSVTDVSASPESEQAVHIINRVYESILSMRKWPFLRKYGTSLVTNTSSIAWELEFPSDFFQMEYMRYNKKDVTYKSPEDFKYLIDGRDTSATNVNSSGIYNDRDPVYWTTFDEKSMVFDGYDSDNATLLPSLCYIQYIRESLSELTDNSDIPELPEAFHPVLFNGALALVFNEMSQDTTKFQMQQREYKAGLARMQRWAIKTDGELRKFGSKQNYGRYGVV